MDALVLAGAKIVDKIENHNKLTNKSLLMLNDIPMIEYVVDALNQAEEVNDIIVVGPPELSQYIEPKVNKILTSTESIIDNIKIGIDYIHKENKIILLTSDIPLITGEVIDRFIRKCQEYEAFLYYPFILKENILQKYPDTVRSYAVLKEGILCGGNAVVFSPELFEKNRDLIFDLYEKRKSVYQYVKLLGFKFILKYLLKSLTIQEIEDRAAEIVGYPVKGIVIDDPEMMIDLDKLSDYELILRMISQNNRNPIG